MSDDLLNTLEAAAKWNVSASYIRRLCRQNRVIGKKVLRDWLVDADSLAQYMEGERKRGRPPIDK